MPTLHFSQALHDELRRECERAHPGEACGLVLGRHEPREGKGPKLVATRLHPARNLRAGERDRFELAPEDIVEADSVARDAGLEIVGTYHSHPDAEAVPSGHDRAGGDPAWLMVIVPVRGSAGGASAGEPRCFAWPPDSAGDLLEQKTCIC